MKHSITTKFITIFTILLAGTMAGLILFSAVFMDRVYVMNHKDALKEMYGRIQEAVTNDELRSDSFQLELEKEASVSAISGIVADSNGSAVVTVGGDKNTLVNQFYDALFLKDDKDEVLERNSSYIISKSKDYRFDGENLLLFGNLSNGDMVLLKVTVQSMKESAQIATRFLIVMSLATLLIGTIVVSIVMRHLTKPIRELTEISRKMADLDFNVKYVPREGNEIDQLGIDMNVLSETLEKTISELKTANNELKLDLDRKDQINQMRTDFLSNVSHELKTPIALIQGYAEGLKDCVQDDEESKNFYCDVIIDESAKMNRMVRKLLTLNELEYGADENEMKRFDITELLNGVLGSMKIMMEQNGIILDYTQKDPFYVWADEYKIEEVLTNYLSNAVNHIDGEKIIHVFLTPKENCVRVSVYNTGKQIPEEDISMLWEKFYTVDKSHSREYGGSGIGLSIVKAIMDALHQGYGVINHDDGVEFWFELDTSLKEESSDDSNHGL